MRWHFLIVLCLISVLSLIGLDKFKKRRPPPTPRLGVLVCRGEGGAKRKMLQFVLGPLGPDSILQTEGSILRKEVTSLKKGGPDRRVAGAPRRLIYVTSCNRLV